jgi:hypothetical protein
MGPLAEYPHCDQRVLHSPGQCTYCDMYPAKQQSRIEQKVNFTGQAFEGLSPCPADLARGIGQAHGWVGNRPKIEPSEIAKPKHEAWKPLPTPKPLLGGFTPRPTRWTKFWLNFFQGKECSKCHKRDPLVGLFQDDVCQDCHYAACKERQSRTQAAEREARIEEMAEAIRRAGCVKK